MYEDSNENFEEDLGTFGGKRLAIQETRNKTTLFNQGSPVSCKAGILRGPGFNKTYIHVYTFTIKLQG